MKRGLLPLVVCILLPALLNSQEPAGQSTLGTGLKAPSKEELSRLVLSVPKKFGAAQLPGKFSLRDQLPPPGDQGKLNSCIGWAVGYGFMTNQVISKRVPPGGFRDARFGNPTFLSPEFLYHYCLVRENENLQPPGGNVSFETAFSVLTNEGICVRPLMTDYKANPSTEAINNAKVFQAMLSTGTIDPHDAHAIKSNLAKGRDLARGTPLPFGIWVDDTFVAPNCHFESTKGTKVWDHYRDQRRSLHAMLLIGWDDSKNAFEAMNSYGEQWGDDHGFLWIDYDFFSTAAVCVYHCDVVPPKKFGVALEDATKSVVRGEASAYCLLGTKDEESGKFDIEKLAFDVRPQDIDNGEIQPGTVLKRSARVPSLNLRSQMTIQVPGKGLSLSEDILGTIGPDGIFKLEELKKFTIKHGRESYYWIGGKVLRGGIPGNN